MKKLTEEMVQNIHHEGGTILGSSRGGFDGKMICDSIESYGFNQVYIIGGDGTHRGAFEIFKEMRKRKARVSIVGVSNHAFVRRNRTDPILPRIDAPDSENN